MACPIMVRTEDPWIQEEMVKKEETTRNSPVMRWRGFYPAFADMEQRFARLGDKEDGKV